MTQVDEKALNLAGASAYEAAMLADDAGHDIEQKYTDVARAAILAYEAAKATTSGSEAGGLIHAPSIPTCGPIAAMDGELWEGENGAIAGRHAADMFDSDNAKAPTPEPAGDVREALERLRQQLADRRAGAERAAKHAREPIADHLEHATLSVCFNDLEAALSAPPSAKAAPGSEVTDDMDLQLLVQLRRDNVYDGARPVIESDQRAWDQAFRLSDAGLIAIEQLAMGGRLHITRKGVAEIERWIAASPAPPQGETLDDLRQREMRAFLDDQRKATS